MTTLREIIEIPLPAKAVEESLLRYLESRRGADGTMSLPLRVPLSDFGIPSGLGVEHTVQVRVNRRRDEDNLNDEFAIAWKPEKDGSYPAFSGRIIVWSEGDPGAAYIELRGTYEPPLGTAGLLFDAALGTAIARSTARRLLEDLREGVLTMRRASVGNQ
ncbi:MAG TPA: hypothetical protein VKT72_14990 [Candidatus Baltobacteraceae bacterium]|nr:hypothetical protein [Candidatus Baltobacteraceae bacterium]